MKKTIILAMCSVVTSLTLQAQMYVTTLGQGNCSLGGAVTDDVGNIYFADRSSCQQIKKIDTSGVISLYASTPGQDPVKPILDTAGNLYVAYHWSPQKSIVKIPAGGGAPQDYVTNISDGYGASSLLFDGDTLYYGEYSSQKIFKVLPGGGDASGSNVTPIQNVYCGIGGIVGERLFDLAWLNNHDMLAAVQNKIYKVNKYTGTSTLLATMPQPVVGLTVLNGTCYFTLWTHHYIYSLDTTTYSYSVFAGTGVQGTLDGPANSAQFSLPDHLSSDNFGNLIVSEYGSGKVRRIWGCQMNVSLLANSACVNDTMFLSVLPTGGNYNTYTYQWSHPNGFIASVKDTFIVVSPNLLNTYVKCQVTDLLGCSVTDSILISDLSSSSSITTSACGSYTSPSGNYTWTSSGIYHDTLQNINGCDSVITINLTITPLPNVSVTQNGHVLTANQSGANYQWVDCDSSYAPIIGATQQTFTAFYNGNFAVIVVQNGCIDTSACYNVSGLGIDEFNNSSSLVIFPNPNNGQFTIQTDKESIFELMDVTGRVINTYRVNGRLDVSENLPAGMYFINEKESGITQKIIVTL